MKTILISLSFIQLVYNAAFAQTPYPSTPEICNNGIDDDGDGNVDLNDPECFCVSQAEDFSLLPNPSFELHNCCQSNVSQTACMENWFQAGYGTTDYLNSCGEPLDIGFSSLTSDIYDILDSLEIKPFPHGDGVVRTVAWQGWCEYLGTCLSSPITAGITYDLNMHLASYNVWDPHTVSTEPININIYGTHCAALPFMGMEPDSTTMTLLAQISYSPTNGWVDLHCSFTPSSNFNAFVFGPEYNLSPYYVDHYQLIFYDHLRLTKGQPIDFPSLEVNGDPCSGNVEVTAISTAHTDISWFEDGVHLNEDLETAVSVGVTYPETSQILLLDNISNTCALADLSELSFEGCIEALEPEFPNILTINNDGINDTYIIANTEEALSIHLKVLNRWGEIVFNSDNYKNDWKPEELSEGVYFYLAEIELSDGKEITGQGPIHLVRSE